MLQKWPNPVFCWGINRPLHAQNHPQMLQHTAPYLSGTRGKDKAQSCGRLSLWETQWAGRRDLGFDHIPAKLSKWSNEASFMKWRWSNSREGKCPVPALSQLRGSKYLWYKHLQEDFSWDLTAGESLLCLLKLTRLIFRAQQIRFSVEGSQRTAHMRT